jgi:hypothetical protein
MAPRYLSKLPLVGDVRKDKAAKEVQDTYFATLHSDPAYLEEVPTIGSWAKSLVPSKGMT